MYLKRLKDLREDNDLMQKEVAYILNISQQYYSQYEQGNNPISLKNLIKLADYYNVSLDYICNRTNKKEVNR